QVVPFLLEIGLKEASFAVGAGSDLPKRLQAAPQKLLPLGQELGIHHLEVELQNLPLTDLQNVGSEVGGVQILKLPGDIPGGGKPLGTPAQQQGYQGGLRRFPGLEILLDKYFTGERFELIRGAEIKPYTRAHLLLREIHLSSSSRRSSSRSVVSPKTPTLPAGRPWRQ